MKKLICVVAAFALAAGCKKKEDTAKKDEAAKPSEPTADKASEPAVKPAEAGMTDIPNANGWVAKVPANAKPNGIGGAAGFHSDDESYQWMWREVSPEEAAKTLDAAKEETLGVKKWIDAKATADGWVLKYVMPYMEMKGEELKETGERYAFDVRRKIGDKTYSCSGSITKEAGYDAVIESCNSVKSK